MSQGEIIPADRLQDLDKDKVQSERNYCVNTSDDKEVLDKNYEDEKRCHYKFKEKMKNIRRFLQVHTYPKGLTKSQKRNFRASSERFLVQNGKLFYKTRVGKPKRNPLENFPMTVLVVTEIKEQKQLVKMVHEGTETLESMAMSGHRGINSAIDILTKRYWWPRLTQDVKDYINTCDRCQKVNKSTLKGKEPLQSIAPPSEVMRMIGVDLCTLPEVDGYKYVAIAIDYLSKFSLAKPLKSKTTIEVAEFLLEWVNIFGCFQVQINDQGTEFNSAVIEELHKRLGCTQRVSTAYHPQTNGLVERQNQTVKNGLLKVLQKQEDWPRALQGIMFAHRTQKHSSTGFSPYKLVFNQEPVLPVDLVLQKSDVQEIKPIPGYFDSDYPVEEVLESTESLLQIAQSIRSKARENIKLSQEKQKKYYDARNSKLLPFQVGQIVLLANHRRNDRKGGWSQDRFSGPYEITKFGSKGVCKLRNTKTKKELVRWINVKSLKLYRERYEKNDLKSEEGAKTIESKDEDDINLDGKEEISKFSQEEIFSQEENFNLDQIKVEPRVILKKIKLEPNNSEERERCKKPKLDSQVSNTNGGNTEDSGPVSKENMKEIVRNGRKGKRSKNEDISNEGKEECSDGENNSDNKTKSVEDCEESNTALSSGANPTSEKLRKDNTSEKEDDFCVLGIEKGHPMHYKPVNNDWQSQKCKELNIPLTKHHSNKSFEPFPCGPPSNVQRIIGDGNCWFRAISVGITGSQKNHEVLRQQITNYMERKGVKEALESYGGRALNPLMKTDGTWATDVEIFGTCMMLNTTIYVWTKMSNGSLAWQEFHPLTLTSFRKKLSTNVFPTQGALYISNSSGNHYEYVKNVQKNDKV